MKKRVGSLVLTLILASVLIVTSTSSKIGQTGCADPVQAQALSETPGMGASTPNSHYLFGVINNEGNHYDDEWARGVRATTFELQWKRYEPAQGVYDTVYIEHMITILRDLKSQGWYVQLAPGYHYVPAWVFSQYPNVYYVNQFGESYNPDPASQGDFHVINAPFNPQARDLIAGYIARIFQDFDQADPMLHFDSVRVGGGVQGELRYPPFNWNGRANSFWAFDSFAQDPSVSGIPVSVVGWRPGIDPNPGSEGRGELIVNPGFEQTHTYFPIPAWSPEDEITAEVVTTNPHEGSRALQLTVTTPHRIHQYVRVEPNTVYDVGGWLKSGDGAGFARIFVNQYDANRQPIPGAPYTKLESKARNWTQQNYSLVTSPSTRFLKVEMDGDRPGIFCFDGLRLNRSGESNSQARDIEAPLAFYEWYVQSLTDYQNWQISLMRQFFDGQIDVLYAGKGLLPNQVSEALTNDLRGDGWGEDSSALYAASLHDRHVASLCHTPAIALYLSGVDRPEAGAVNDQSPNRMEWSAARWIAGLAHGCGLAVWGENSGQDNLASMQLSAERMHANGFIGLMWGFESELYANSASGYATIEEYQAIITHYANLNRVHLPLVMRQSIKFNRTDSSWERGQHYW